MGPLLVLWFTFAIVAGAVASGRGRSGVGWFLFAILLSPLIGLIVVALLPRTTPTPVTVVEGPKADATSQIASLASLRDSGAISEDEYATKKTELLSRV
jgi:Short C-terminal domain